MVDSVRVKRGLRLELPNSLPLGELAYCTDTSELFVGTGESIKKVIDPELIKNFENLNKQVGILDEKVEPLGNHNLFSNGDFSVWTKGTIFHNHGYCADRWRFAGDTNLTVNKTPKGVKLTVVSEGTWSNLVYYMPVDEAKKLVGKQLTLTFKSTEKAINKVTQIWVYDFVTHIYHLGKDCRDGVETDTYSASFVLGEVQGDIEFGIQLDSIVGNYLELEWAKLEVGDKLTPFIPRPYVQELQDCLMFDEGKLTIPYSNPNLLINGDFQVWQRGTSFAYNGSIPTQSSIYTADRWRIVQSDYDATFIVGKGNSSNGAYLSILNMNKKASTLLTLHQKLEAYHLQAGTYTLSYECCHTSTISHRMRIYSFGTQLHPCVGDIKTYNGSGEWEKYTYTFQLTNADISNILEFSFDLGIDEPNTNGSFFIRNVKLELGTVATPLSPRPYAEELMMCQRYYQKLEFCGNIDSLGRLPIYRTINMRITPTLTKASHNNTELPNVLDRFGYGGITFSSIQLIASDANRVVFLQCASHQPEAIFDMLYDGYLLLDAEIY